MATSRRAWGGDEPAAMADLASADRINDTARSGEPWNSFANSVGVCPPVRSGNISSRTKPVTKDTIASDDSEGRITHRRQRVIPPMAPCLVIEGSNPARNNDDLPEPLIP